MLSISIIDAFAAEIWQTEESTKQHVIIVFAKHVSVVFKGYF